jgi:hypothetical protein
MASVEPRHGFRHGQRNLQVLTTLPTSSAIEMDAQASLKGVAADWQRFGQIILLEREIARGR